MPSNAAIHYVPAGYDTKGPKLMGRMAAGEGFLAAWLRHAGVERLYCYAAQRKDAEAFAALARETGAAPVEWLPWATPQAIGRPGALYLPDPGLHAHAWRRRAGDQRAYSLTGITHTTASASAMDLIAELPVAPVQEWDALICTSRAVKAMVEGLLDEQQAYLTERLGAARFTRPQFPVIPLGVDCAKYAPDPAARAAQRAALGIAPEDIAVLFMGRLSFHAKAHPYPMYLALERAARESGKRLHVIQAGWFANDFIESAFRDGAKAFCPGVTAHFVDGRKSETRFAIWQAADLFTSLSDNIQETFGLTPIEAMAAGLPSVVSDWDGYRDTIEDGVHGMRVPTLAPPAGQGDDLADAHAIELDTYDRYCGYSSQFVAIDVPAAVEAYLALIGDADLRRRMGTAARTTALAMFDWRHIVARYQDLWSDLAGRRRTTAESAPAADQVSWPARPDPFAAFAAYPSRTLSMGQRLALGDYPADLTALTEHPLFAFAKQRLRLDLCALILSEVRQRTTTLAQIGASLGEADRRYLPRQAVWLAKIGAIKVLPR
ncbi:MAG TPA: glycosyltransferase family 4 protein [Dongiaceae bacterium]|nr:glycosyltransferase family 4 protein [Dongiaceae bacterium]